LSVFFFRSLYCLSFSFGHCIVCLFLSVIVLSVFFFQSLYCLSFSFGHCIVCLFLSVIVLSVFFFRSLYCLSFLDLRLLITPLIFYFNLCLNLIFDNLLMFIYINTISN
jgi:hypothetical protein